MVASAKLEAMERNNRALREHMASVRIHSPQVEEDEFATSADMPMAPVRTHHAPASTFVPQPAPASHSEPVAEDRPPSVASVPSDTGSHSSTHSHRVEVTFNAVMPPAAHAHAGDGVERVSITRGSRGEAKRDGPLYASVAAPTPVAVPVFTPPRAPDTPQNIRAIRDGITSLDADIAALESLLSASEFPPLPHL